MPTIRCLNCNTELELSKYGNNINHILGNHLELDCPPKKEDST